MTEAANGIDLARLQSWIGREEEIYDIISVDLVRKFNATLDLGDSLPGEGDIAPLLIHFCLGQPAVPASGLGEDGHPQRGGFLPPVPLPRRMWAGGSFTFHGSFRVGDRVRRHSQIADVTLKQGRSGPLCFVAVDHLFDVDGEIIIRERQDLVYREAASGQSAAEKPAAPLQAIAAGSHHKTVQPDTTLLFRYSALTFNGHRIHYDLDYARAVEQYPGLVVHGPLQATWLLQFASSLFGRPPASFSFRGQSPLFHDDLIEIHARKEAGTIHLWTQRQGGPIAMSAEAKC